MSGPFRLSEENCLETLQLCCETLNNRDHKEHANRLLLMIRALESGEIKIESKCRERPYRRPNCYIPPAL